MEKHKACDIEFKLKVVDVAQKSIAAAAWEFGVKHSSTNNVRGCRSFLHSNCVFDAAFTNKQDHINLPPVHRYSVCDTLELHFRVCMACHLFKQAMTILIKCPSRFNAPTYRCRKEKHRWPYRLKEIKWYMMSLITKLKCFTTSIRMKTQQQTNGDAITASGQKPMLDNSIGKDRIAYSSTPIILTAPITVDPEKRLLLDPDPGPSSPSRT